jgi:hypothetical protein
MKSKMLSIWGMGIFLFSMTTVPAAFVNLQNLPSAPGSHLARINAMGDDTWLDLGSPEADPTWGKGRGRSWTPKMADVPEKRAGLLCATGVHGYVKPDGHYMDDLWAYDINAHKWICLYPGAGTPSSSDPLDLHLDSNNFEINDAGEDVPVSYLSHGYCNLTFNTDLNLYQIFWTQCPWWRNALPQRDVWLNIPDTTTSAYALGDFNASVKHPLYYDINTGLWDRRFVPGTAGPDRGRHEGVLEYIPTIQKTFMKYKKGVVWFYDYPTNTWEQVRYTGDTLFGPSDYDYLGCYDTRRDRVYIGKGTDFWYYDIQANSATKISAASQPNLSACNSSTMTYDISNDVVVVNNHGSDLVYAYSPVSNAWSRQADMTGSQPSNSRVSAFYDPVLNVHFYHCASDSRDNGTMLAYRYEVDPSTVSRGRPAVGAGPMVQVHPNPFSRGTAISLNGQRGSIAIYRLDGKRMVQGHDRTGFLWNTSGLPAGIYILKVSIGKLIISKKLILN